jgi:hypothetical protein
MHDNMLLSRFEEGTLDRSDWIHRAHVQMAYIYLRRWPYDEALERIRSGIKRNNARWQVPDGPTSGYNETTTQAFLRLIAATMAAYGEVIPTADGQQFCDAHPQLMTTSVLRLFYSPAVRLDPRGKTEFLEADLASLPPIPRDRRDH